MGFKYHHKKLGSIVKKSKSSGFSGVLNIIPLLNLLSKVAINLLLSACYFSESLFLSSLIIALKGLTIKSNNPGTSNTLL